MYKKSLVKMPNKKINENPFTGSQAVACRHSKAEKRIFATSHCECTKKNKYVIYIIRR
jgi:hypothetical protein